MASWRAPVGLAAISLFAVACSNFGLVDDDEQPLVGVSSLVDGGYLTPQSPVIVQITAPPAGEEVLSIDVALLDVEGAPIWESLLEAPPTNEPIEVGPFDELALADGAYTLRFTVTTSQSAIIEELTFFHVTDDYLLQALTAFPPVSAAGSTATLSATLAVPAGRDPFLRWWQADQLIAEGMLSDGYDAASWPTPVEAGIYAVSLEVFPVPPTTGMVHPLPLAARDVSVYVVAADPTEASANHLVLLRFDATLTDSAPGTSSDPAALDGSASVLSGFAPLFGALGSDIGYVMDPDRQLELARSLLPAVGDDGESRSVAFSVSLTLRADQPTGVLLASEGGDLQLVLALDDAGIPMATLASGASSATLLAGEPLGPDVSTLTLSASIAADHASLAWYQDGVQTAGGVDLPFALTTAGDEGTPGRTVIGGAEFRGILGELSTYVRDDAGAATTDPDAAYTTLAVAADEGAWATGFDTTVAADPLSTLRHAAGYAVIDGGDTLLVPLATADEGYARLAFASGAGAGASMTLSGAADDHSVTVPLDGATAAALTWSADGGGVSLAVTRETDPPGEAVGLTLASPPTKLSVTTLVGERLLLDHLILSAAPDGLPSSD